MLFIIPKKYKIPPLDGFKRQSSHYAHLELNVSEVNIFSKEIFFEGEECYRYRWFEKYSFAPETMVLFERLHRAIFQNVHDSFWFC